MDNNANNWSFSLKVISLVSILFVGFMSNQPESNNKAENLLDTTKKIDVQNALHQDLKDYEEIFS